MKPNLAKAETKKITKILLLFCLLIFILSKCVFADDFDFSKMEMSFKNFVKCELTRTDAVNHFNGKSFAIKMIDFYDIQTELDIKIITGVIKCFVDDKDKTLYAAVGLRTIIGKEQIAYYTIRDHDFSILATELYKYPYKERCTWSQYWIDID